MAEGRLDHLEAVTAGAGHPILDPQPEGLEAKLGIAGEREQVVQAGRALGQAWPARRRRRPDAARLRESDAEVQGTVAIARYRSASGRPDRLSGERTSARARPRRARVVQVRIEKDLQVGRRDAPLARQLADRLPGPHGFLGHLRPRTS